LRVSAKQGEIGPDPFRAACKFGLECWVSKRRSPEQQFHARSYVDLVLDAIEDAQPVLTAPIRN